MQLVTSILLLVAFVLFVELVLGEDEASGTRLGALSWRIAGPGWASGMDGQPPVIAVPIENRVATTAAEVCPAVIDDDAHPIEAHPVHHAEIRLGSHPP